MPRRTTGRVAGAPSRGRPEPDRPSRRGWRPSRAPSGSPRARRRARPSCRRTEAPASCVPASASTRRGRSMKRGSGWSHRRRWRAPPAPCPTPRRRPIRPTSHRSSAPGSTGCGTAPKRCGSVGGQDAELGRVGLAADDEAGVDVALGQLLGHRRAVVAGKGQPLTERRTRQLGAEVLEQERHAAEGAVGQRSPAASDGARSKSSWMTALSCGLSSSMRAMAASTSSAGEASLVRTNSACAVASSHAVSSLMGTR